MHMVNVPMMRREKNVSKFQERYCVRMNDCKIKEWLLTEIRITRNHRLPDWHIFCDFIEKLPRRELITGKDEKYWKIILWRY